MNIVFLNRPAGIRLILVGPGDPHPRFFSCFDAENRGKEKVIKWYSLDFYPPVSQWSKTGDKTKIPKIFGLFFFIKLKHCKFSNRLRQPERSKARGGKNPTNSTDEEGDVFSGE